MTQDQRNKKAEQLRLAAHIIETGCEWEAQAYSGEWVSSRYSPLKIECDNDPVSVLEHGLDIRIKEWKLPDPPAGRKWHREDWTQDMLPDGWRPLLDGEKWIKGDQILRDSHKWETAGDKESDTLDEVTTSTKKHCRTRRPLPEPVIPVPEGWRELPDSEKDGRWIEGAKFFAAGEWTNPGSRNSGAYAFSRYRIIVPVAKPKKRVPLGPGDIPPLTVLETQDKSGWNMIVCADKAGVVACDIINNLQEYSYEELIEDGSRIKRPTDTEWQPCFKEVEP